MKRKYVLLAASFFVIILIGLLLHSELYAYDSSNEVTIGNSPPEFVIDPYVDTHEDDAENALSRSTYTAVGLDSNGDKYYLLVCESDEISLNKDGRYGCEDTTLCISNDTESNTEASCRYHSENNIQVGFSHLYLCDTNIDTPRCSEGRELGDGDYIQSAEIISSIYQEFPELDALNEGNVLGASTENSNGSGFEFKFTNQFLLIGALLIASALFVFLLSQSLKHETAERRAVGFLSFAVIVMVAFYGLTALVTPDPGDNTSSENVQGVSEDRDSGENEEIVTLQRPSKAGLYEIFMEPDVDSTVVYYATESEPFPVLGEESGWLLILLPNGTNGWIPKSNAQ